MPRVIHLDVGTPEHGMAACGTKRLTVGTSVIGHVTCQRCRASAAYKHATLPATQPLTGIVLAPVACLSCGEPADEVNMSVNVSTLDEIGDYVPGAIEYGSTLSDRIGTFCPACGITLDDGWPLTVLSFVGKQNGTTP